MKFANHFQIEGAFLEGRHPHDREELFTLYYPDGYEMEVRCGGSSFCTSAAYREQMRKMAQHLKENPRYFAKFPAKP